MNACARRGLDRALGGLETRIAKKATDTDIFTLHRYFLWATHMANNLRIAIEQQGPFPKDPKDLQHWLRVPFMNLSYWFASLYVATEAWQDLKLSDPSLDPSPDS